MNSVKSCDDPSQSNNTQPTLQVKSAWNVFYTEKKKKVSQHWHKFEYLNMKSCRCSWLIKISKLQRLQSLCRNSRKKLKEACCSGEDNDRIVVGSTALLTWIHVERFGALVGLLKCIFTQGGDMKLWIVVILNLRAVPALLRESARENSSHSALRKTDILSGALYCLYLKSLHHQQPPPPPPPWGVLKWSILTLF